MPMKTVASLLLFVLLLGPSIVNAQQNSADICRTTPGGTAMDFLIGSWRVVDPSTFVELGRNSFTRSLDGCLVEESWVGADGFESKSIYYFEARNARWKQLWLTGNTAQTGGLKLRTQLTGFEGAGIRYQGTLTDLDNSQILDRSTLFELGDGRVRQLIEQSRESGTTWTTLFDAYYLPIK